MFKRGKKVIRVNRFKFKANSTKSLSLKYVLGSIP